MKNQYVAAVFSGFRDSLKLSASIILALFMVVSNFVNHENNGNKNAQRTDAN